MAKFNLEKNPMSVILVVKIQDSSKTDGSGIAGLDHTSGIVGNFIQRSGLGIALAIDEEVDTPGTYQAPSVVGKVRIGVPANSRPGAYELHFHNDVFAGADWVTMPNFGGASNMADLAIEVQCNLPTNFNALGVEADGDLTKCNLVAVTTLNSDMYAEVMRGTDGANTVVPDAAGVAPTAVENRQEMDASSTGLAAIFQNTNFDIPALIGALNDLSIADIVYTALTQTYSVKGSEATLAQLLYEIIGELREFDFTGAVKTVKKLDNSTAYTNQLDSSTAPTSSERLS